MVNGIMSRFLRLKMPRGVGEAALSRSAVEGTSRLLHSREPKS